MPQHDLEPTRIAVRTPMPRVSDRTRVHASIGVVALLCLVGGLGGWAATAELAGAVISQGTVVVDSNVKKVQHATGGIVGEIFVRDGDRVASGDLLLRLDDTITRANLGIITSQLDELEVRKARLVTERDGDTEVALPTTISARMAEAAVLELVAGERLLFESRRTGREGQKAQLKERMAQLQREIEGLDAQQTAKTREISLIEKELVGLIELQGKSLVPSIRVMSLQRDEARLQGERAQHIAAVAQARGRIAEISLQVIQLDQDLRTEVTKELREVQAKMAELSERRIAAQDQLRRIDVRSPQAGVVHQMGVHTIGGVISPSEPIMLIVPEGEALVIEARVAPQDIDQVSPGQVSIVRFSAFNQRTTPELTGAVQRVAADLIREPQLNQGYFVTRIQLSSSELSRLGTLKLVPGMPAEVHIRTSERTPLSYLLKPLTDQFARAFTER